MRRIADTTSAPKKQTERLLTLPHFHLPKHLQTDDVVIRRAITTKDYLRGASQMMGASYEILYQAWDT